MLDAENDCDDCNARAWNFFVRPVTSFNNLGDLLICRALVQNLAKYGVVYVDGNAGPSRFIETLTEGLDRVHITKRFYTRLASSRISGRRIGLVTIPGHFFGEGIGKAVSTAFGGIVLASLRAIGVRIFKFGGCVGPLDRWVLAAERFRRFWFSYYGLRDSESLKCIGASRNTHYFPDLAFIAEGLSVAESGADYFVVSFRAETNSQLRSESYPDLIRTRLCDLLDSLPNDHHLVFCHQVPSDAAFVSELYEFFRDAGRSCELVEQILSFSDAVRLYGNASCVLSNRLHILLPSLMMGVRHLAVLDVDKHHKISAIYRDNNLEPVLCDIVDQSTLMPEPWGVGRSTLLGVANENRQKASAILSNLFG